jgi:hypothetical protein
MIFVHSLPFDLRMEGERRDAYEDEEDEEDDDEDMIGWALRVWTNWMGNGR